MSALEEGGVHNGLPFIVWQALRDVSLSQSARLTMFHLAGRLDFVRFREVKVASLANEMRAKEVTVGAALRVLVREGYLEEHGKKRPRAFRLPWSRRVDSER